MKCVFRGRHQWHPFSLLIVGLLCLGLWGCRPGGEGGAGTSTPEPAASSDDTEPAEKEAPVVVRTGPTDVVTVKWLPEPIECTDSVAETEADMKPYTELIPDTDEKFDVVPIPGGKFTMGSPESEEGRWLTNAKGKLVKDKAGNKVSDEGPQHEVTIEPFWMGKCEVTWDEYGLWGLRIDEQRRAYYHKKAGTEPSDREKLIDAIAMPTPPYVNMSFDMGQDGYPAICMTQIAARGYCKWLSAKTGRFYRLPTEAEWEYACRAGSTTAFSFGDNADDLDDYGWYYDNSDSGEKYHKVGLKKPNPWGLYDMHGNVMEWVLDQYKVDFYKQFEGKTTARPIAPAVGEYPQVARGGSFWDDPERLRSAARLASNISWKSEDPQIPQSIWYETHPWCPGFRVVRPLKVPDEEEAKLYEWDTKVIHEYHESQAGKE